MVAACGIRVRRTVVHARGADPRGVGQWVALVQRVDASGLAAAVLTAAVRVRGAWRPPDPRLVSPRCPVLRQVGHAPRLVLVIGAARVGPALDGRTSPAITAAEFGTCPERAVPPPGLLPVTRAGLAAEPTGRRLHAIDMRACRPRCKRGGPA